MSELQLHTRTDDGIHFIEPRGEISLETAPSFHAVVLSTLEQRPVKIIIDLAGVTYMDSSGVGTLVDIKRRAGRSGGELFLMAPQPMVKSVLEITQLTRFFRIIDRAEEARGR